MGRKLILSLVKKFQQGEKLEVDAGFLNGLRSILCDSTLDKVKLFLFEVFFCVMLRNPLLNKFQ
jgi:hypothetical protein